MHRFVARMLVLALGTGDLICCADAVPLPAANSAPKPFDVLGDTSPDIVADAFVGADLKTARVQVSAAQCSAACGPLSTGCEAVVVVSGDANRPTHMTGNLECHFPERHDGGGWDPFHLSSCPFGCGRRPASAFELPREHAIGPFHRHLMDIALLEALSVGAFAQLARDLREHAPRFLPRAFRAQEDERRHARRARAVLRELGGSPRRVPRVALVARGLTDAALDNAVEGCVHETFGAIVASIQARRAQHPAIRRFFASIAPDELEHAALSWDVHDELWPRLTPEAHAKITASRLRALSQIDEMPSLPALVRAQVGAPSLEERRALVKMMRTSLCSPGIA